MRRTADRGDRALSIPRLRQNAVKAHQHGRLRSMAILPWPSHLAATTSVSQDQHIPGVAVRPKARLPWRKTTIRTSSLTRTSWAPREDYYSRRPEKTAPPKYSASSPLTSSPPQYTSRRSNYNPKLKRQIRKTQRQQQAAEEKQPHQSQQQPMMMTPN